MKRYLGNLKLEKGGAEKSANCFDGEQAEGWRLEVRDGVPRGRLGIRDGRLGIRDGRLDVKDGRLDAPGASRNVDSDTPCPRCSGLLFEERIPFQLHMEYTCYNCGNRLLGPYAEEPDVLRPLPPEEQPGERVKAKRSGSHGGKRAVQIKKARKNVRATFGQAPRRRKG